MSDEPTLLALVPSQATQARAISILGYPIVSAPGIDAALADRRARPSRRGRAQRAPADDGVLARPHSSRHRLFRRRGIVVITSENFDGESIAGIIERFGYGTARGSTSRGGRKACCS